MYCLFCTLDLRMDAMAMTFEDASYDVVIDKATFDTVIVMCSE